MVVVPCGTFALTDMMDRSPFPPMLVRGKPGYARFWSSVKTAFGFV